MTDDEFKDLIGQPMTPQRFLEEHMGEWELPAVVDCPHLPIRLALSEERISNLLVLADYLDSLPGTYAKFDMNLYMVEEGENLYYARDTSCGSVACALGHGPVAGIKPLWRESWDSYSDRVFIPTEINGRTMTNMEHAWSWCFGASWYGVDNTPRGAARRIRYLLDKGLPANWSDQMRGKAGLSYTMS